MEEAINNIEYANKAKQKISYTVIFYMKWLAEMYDRQCCTIIQLPETI